MDGLQGFEKNGDYRAFHGPAAPAANRSLNGSSSSSLNGSNGSNSVNIPNGTAFKPSATAGPRTSKMNGDANGPAVPIAPPLASEHADDDTRHMHRHMWIVTGTAGSGKTTVAEYLAHELQVPYIEGDDVSSTLPSNLSSPRASHC